jgi:hypothetical protein
MGSGMTDPDTIAALGRQLGAQYVVAGSITGLGNQKLLIIAIIKIDELRQVAGDIQTYGSINEIRGKLPAMAKNIVDATKKNASNLPRLAVPPVRLSGGADTQETDTRNADTLAQILAVHLVRNGKYAVYPRTKSLEQVQNEYGNQFGGDVADEYLPRAGMGNNPRLVLSVTARKLGGNTMFNAVVINLETGDQEAGDTVDYQNLESGVRIMQELALRLTGQDNEANAIKNAAARAEQDARKKAAADVAWAEKTVYAERKSLDLPNLALEWTDDITDVVGEVDFHWSFLPFTSIGIGIYPFWVGGWGVSLYAGLVYPLTTNGWSHSDFNALIYADFLYNAQGTQQGLGFDAGLILSWDAYSTAYGIDIRYRGIVYDGRYVNSIGIGFVILFDR